MNNNSPHHDDLVSIVTVTYNAETCLEDTIHSVLNQTYENIEYIIIDGASTDRTVDIIKQYTDKVDYWISEPDAGIYFAMNKAIAVANGKWINFMNAGDTFYSENTVRTVMDKKDSNADLIYGDFMIKESGAIRKAYPMSTWHLYMPFSHQSLFTRTQIMKHEMFDTSFRLAADHHFILKMFHTGKRFYYVEEIVSVFELGGFAVSNELLMNIESLKVLLDMEVSESELIQSHWFQSLLGQYCVPEYIKQKNPLDTPEDLAELSADDCYNLYIRVLNITKHSVLKSPLKKLRCYKAMLRHFHRIQRGAQD